MIGTKFKTTVHNWILVIVGPGDCFQIIITQGIYADLKRDFEMGEMVLKLSLSLNVHISTSDQISGWMSARGKSKVCRKVSKTY